MTDNKVKLILDEINISDIKSITIRTVGLIDVFGKMIIDIKYNNSTEQHIDILSPVPVSTITNWLKSNNLLEKSVMYEF